jgi:hypothetical protein
MKRKIYAILTVALLFGSASVFAQKDNVGIGTTSPDASAVLDIQSSNKGLLIPRMSLDQRKSVERPATGLMIYQTDEKAGFYFYNGDDWKPLTEAVGNAKAVALDVDNWSKNGDAVSGANFIGTTNAFPLKFRVQNVAAGYIDNNGGTAGMFLGRGSGNGNTGTYSSGFGYATLGSNNSGTQNTALGAFALFSNSSGFSNIGIGAFTLYANTTGSYNLGIGTNSFRFNSTGTHGVAIGFGSLYNNTTGSKNIGLGSTALYQNTTGSDNVAIGFESLRNNIVGLKNIAIGTAAGKLATGSSNIFIGFGAGENETGSNKLYFANSNTSAPLIKGEFDNKNLKINTGATTSTTLGFLAVGNFDAAFTMPVGNSYRLIVQDGIITEKVKVALKTTADWADYVFEPGYKLMSLEDTEKFTKENKHLPNVPSAEEMAKNGLDVGQTSKMFMEKIEELTLYLIDIKKELNALKLENEALKLKK